MTWGSPLLIQNWAFEFLIIYSMRFVKSVSFLASISAKGGAVGGNAFLFLETRIRFLCYDSQENYESYFICRSPIGRKKILSDQNHRRKANKDGKWSPERKEIQLRDEEQRKGRKWKGLEKASAAGIF